MESESKFRELWNKITDWLEEQQWYQELQAKWEQLDPQSRTYLKYATSLGSLVLVLTILLSFVWTVRGLRRELSEKTDLLSLLQNANEEMRRLKETTGGSEGGEFGGPWPAYIEGAATQAGIDKSALTVSPEKAGAASDLSKEALIDVAVKHVSIKQVVRLAFQLESGTRPVKLRALSINTQADPEGYLDANLSISGFSIIDKEGRER